MCLFTHAQHYTQHFVVILILDYHVLTISLYLTFGVCFSLFDAFSLIRFDKNLITNTYWPTNTDRHRWYDRELKKHARLTSWKSSLFELKSFINYISWQQKLEEKKNCDAIDSFFSNTWVETLDYVTKTLKLLCFFSSTEVV